MTELMTRWPEAQVESIEAPVAFDAFMQEPSAAAELQTDHELMAEQVDAVYAEILENSPQFAPSPERREILNAIPKFKDGHGNMLFTYM
jgi:hypothetical protein